MMYDMLNHPDVRFVFCKLEFSLLSLFCRTLTGLGSSFLVKRMTMRARAVRP